MTNKEFLDLFLSVTKLESGKALEIKKKDYRTSEEILYAIKSTNYLGRGLYNVNNGKLYYLYDNGVDESYYDLKYICTDKAIRVYPKEVSLFRVSLNGKAPSAHPLYHMLKEELDVLVIDKYNVEGGYGYKMLLLLINGKVN